MEKHPDRTYLLKAETTALSNTEMEGDLAADNEARVQSIWENSTEGRLAHLMADWEGRQETFHMFLQSYD